MKENCWEFKKCGRGKGGNKIDELGACPVTKFVACNGINGGENAGRMCWLVAGTFGGGQRQGTFAQKKQTCMTCDFFVKVKKEEGTDFKMT
ncbi:MAG: hypothetical protein KKH94_08335 [Candidatus Omnitrophica bacterium]|nr:hypothetical protein [Candidatus Omnitrophota bacterium]